MVRQSITITLALLVLHSLPGVSRAGKPWQPLRQRFAQQCRRNDGVACIQLAEMYGFPNPRASWYAKVRALYIRGRRLMRRQCARRSGLACHTLAGLNIGEGVFKANRAKANRWYRRARKYDRRTCRKGGLDACVRLAEMYRFGLGGKKDIAACLRLREKVCQSGVANQCDRLADDWRMGRFGKRDPARIKRYTALSRAHREKGCLAGKIADCAMLSRGWRTGAYGTQDPVKARRYLHRSETLEEKHCKAGNGRACYLLSQTLRTKRKRNGPRAAQILKTLCAQRVPEACHDAGNMHAWGEGIPRNREKAKHYYGLSCKMAFDTDCKYAR